jgi:hypothetical protein
MRAGFVKGVGARANVNGGIRRPAGR